MVVYTLSFCCKGTLFAVEKDSLVTLSKKTLVVVVTLPLIATASTAIDNNAIKTIATETIAKVDIASWTIATAAIQPRQK